jgi:hypothetical protein
MDHLAQTCHVLPIAGATPCAVTCIVTIAASQALRSYSYGHHCPDSGPKPCLIASEKPQGLQGLI